MSLALGRVMNFYRFWFLNAMIVACFGFGGVRLSANDSPETMLSLQYERISGYSSGASYYFTPSNADFPVIQQTYARGVWIRVWGDTLVDLSFEPSEGTLTNGMYLFAERFPLQSSGHPGLTVSVGSSGCNKSAGEFYVKQATVDDQGKITSFWALFKQLCESASPALYGEVRINVDTTVVVSAPFQTNVQRGRTLSFEVSATGHDDSQVALSALDLPAGAQFTDHGDNTGTFTWTPARTETGWFTVLFQGQDENGHIDQSPTRIHITGTTELRINRRGEPDDVSSGTNAVFHFYDNPYLPDDRINLLVRGERYSWHLDFAAPLNQRLVPGVYTNTTQVESRNASQPGMSIGWGHWNLTTNSWFAVKQIEYGPLNTLESLHIVFEQRDSGDGPPVMAGELLYNAKIALDLVAPIHVYATNGALLEFRVQATDVHSQRVFLVGRNLPAGARFVDHGDNTGTFFWKPLREQAGHTTAQFQAVTEDGKRKTAHTYITVRWINAGPTARAGGPYKGMVGIPVCFDGTGSFDPDWDDIDYFWYYGDGSRGSGPRSRHIYRFPGIYNMALMVRDEEYSSRDFQKVTIGTCDGLDLALSLVQARWLSGSRGGMRTLEAIFRLRNQGVNNSTKPGLTFRTLSPSQGYVAPLTLRVGPLAAGYERLLHIRVPVFLRKNASVQFPEIIASVSPESNQRDCFLSNNQVRVCPKRQPEPPLNPGHGSGTGCVITASGSIPPPVFTNDVPEIPPSEEDPASEQ